MPDLQRVTIHRDKPPVFGCVADVHIGNHSRCGGQLVAGLNDRCRKIIQVLDNAVTRCFEEGVTDFVVCGDLFDSPNPNPQMLYAVSSIILRFPTMTFHLVLGNHDMRSTHPGDNALGVLSLWPTVHVYEQPTLVSFDYPGGTVVGAVEYTHTLMVPFVPGKDMCVVTQTAVRETQLDSIDLLCVHAGLSTGQTQVWLLSSREHIPDFEFNEEPLCRVLVTAMGNWHNRLVAYPKKHGDGSRLVTQLGALVPTGWDNPGTNPYGAALITSCNSWETVHFGGPRFLNVSHIEAVSAAVIFAHECKQNLVYLRVLYPPGSMEIAQRRGEALRKEGVFVDVIVEPQPMSTDEIKRVHTELLVNVNRSLESTISSYVHAHLPLETKVPRGEVERVALEVFNGKVAS